MLEVRLKEHVPSRQTGIGYERNTGEGIFVFVFQGDETSGNKKLNVSRSFDSVTQYILI